MRNKKKSLLNYLNTECTKKVRICTQKFCVIGCLEEKYDDDDIVCLRNAKIIRTEKGCGGEIEYKDTVCICDDHIIAFEAIKDSDL